MDFRAAIELLATFFDSQKAPYAVIGGVAMAALGMPRTTLDIDIVVPAGVQDALVAHLEGLGYETLHRSAGYSNHLHPDPERGRIDVVYVRDDTERRLFGAVEVVPGFEDRELPVPKPVHLAAMKLFSIRNDPGRAERELEDVRFLIESAGVDRDRVDEYLRRYGLEELRGRLDDDH